MKLTIDSSIDSIDLSPLKHLVDWSPGAQYFTLGPGQEHYKLLAHLSAQLPDYAQAIDCGTLFGCSALALSSNEKVNVHTFDTEDRLAGPGEAVKMRPNIYFHREDCIAAVPDMLDGVQPLVIVLDIDPHDGIQEKMFVQKLVDFGYQGLLICDDIHLNDQMQHWWDEWVNFTPFFTSKHTPKFHDVTRYGHWSGTGIVAFDPETIDVEVK